MRNMQKYFEFFSKKVKTHDRPFILQKMAENFIIHNTKWSFSSKSLREFAKIFQVFQQKSAKFVIAHSFCLICLTCFNFPNYGGRYVTDLINTEKPPLNTIGRITNFCPKNIKPLLILKSSIEQWIVSIATIQFLK